MSTDPIKIKLGIFKGVFIPTSLTIFGVILFLRVGIITGEIGLIRTISIISLASLLTLITSFSISSLASNMKLKNGGLYYITSRILGIEIGAAIGLSIYLAQAIGISFYISGFTESIIEFFPSLNHTLVSILSLLVLISISLFFPKMIFNLQTIILLLIIISLIGVYYGLWTHEPVSNDVDIKPQGTYWKYFALFFPAVTGIESGISFAGELKDQRKAIPLGMISAVIVGYVIYITLSLSIYRHIPTNEMVSDYQILAKYTKYHKLFFVGLWSASLSSALTTINGAPQILYQIAQDKVIPQLFLKVHGKYNRPFMCQLLTTTIALVSILIGNLNIIAPVLSMFFLCSYATLNFTCSLQGITNNPLWRPTFKLPWLIALLSAILCLLIMLLINTLASYACFAFIFLIYYYTKSKAIIVNWQDIRPRLNLFSIKKSLETLNENNLMVDHWVPNIILPTKATNLNIDLITIGNKITSKSGFLTLFLFVPEEKETDQNTLVKQYIQRLMGFFEDKLYIRILNSSSYISQTLPLIFQSYGIGPIKPNTLLISSNQFSPREIGEILYHSQKFDQNTLIVHNLNLSDIEEKENFNPKNIQIQINKINLWITQTSPNAGLIILLSDMIRRNIDSSQDLKVTFKTIVSSPEEEEGVKNKLESLIHTKRLDQYEYEIYREKSEFGILDQIASQTSKSSISFIGLKRLGDSLEEYIEYLEITLQKFENSENTIFILSDSKTSFDRIFKIDN